MSLPLHSRIGGSGSNSSFRSHRSAGASGSSSPFDKLRNRSSPRHHTIMGIRAPRALAAAGVLALFFTLIVLLRGRGPVHQPPHKTTSSSSNGNNSAKQCSDPSEYVLMIDAGSTGSRIHAYEFNTCGEVPSLVNEVFEMIKPGLSSYPNDPEAAARSLDPLMQVAMRAVPESARGCTPVAVKATAGLRKLGEEKGNTILKAVREHLERDYPFPVVEGDGVSIMEGSDEGVYAWVTLNYLLGNIGTSEKTPTAAVFDLGGGSTQIVFEPSFPEAGSESVAPGDHRFELSFGGRDFILYQHSHLGYGLMEARNKVHKAVVENSLGVAGNSLSSNNVLVNPCMAPDTYAMVDVEIEEDSPRVAYNMTGPREFSAALCRGLTEGILSKDALCDVPPCSFNGVHQPSLSKTFEKEDIFIFSYFYDRTAPLGMPHSFTLEELKELTDKVCRGKLGWEPFVAIDSAMDELAKEPEYCLDLNFMISILHHGYDIPLTRSVKIAKKIQQKEIGWCLGASLPLLDKIKGGWKCKAT